MILRDRLTSPNSGPSLSTWDRLSYWLTSLTWLVVDFHTFPITILFRNNHGAAHLFLNFYIAGLLFLFGRFGLACKTAHLTKVGSQKVQLCGVVHHGAQPSKRRAQRCRAAREWVVSGARHSNETQDQTRLTGSLGQPTQRPHHAHLHNPSSPKTNHNHDDDSATSILPVVLHFCTSKWNNTSVFSQSAERRNDIAPETSSCYR